MKLLSARAYELKSGESSRFLFSVEFDVAASDPPEDFHIVA